MGQNKISELFFENPSKEFYLRQIAKITKIPKTTVSRLLQQLLKENLIIRKKSEPYNRYIANTENPMYKFYKKWFIIEKIYKSGIIEYIVNKAHPKAIILFGSCAKGEYFSGSDIDIFVNSPETHLNLDNFKLKHNINPFFEPNILSLSKELRQSIINGIVLYGMIKL